MSILKEIYIKAIENKWNNKQLVAEMKKYFTDKSIVPRGVPSNKIYICLVALLNSNQTSQDDMNETIEYIFRKYGDTYYNFAYCGKTKVIFNRKPVDNKFNATCFNINNDDLVVKHQTYDAFTILTNFMNDFSDDINWEIRVRQHQRQEEFSMELHAYVRNLYCLV